MGEKQEWSPRQVPRMQIEIRLDMEGVPLQAPFRTRDVEEAITELLNDSEFEPKLRKALEKIGQPADIADASVRVIRFRL